MQIKLTEMNSQVKTYKMLHDITSPPSGQDSETFGHWHLLKSQPHQQNKGAVCSIISN